MKGRVCPELACMLLPSVDLRGEAPWHSFSRAQAPLPVPGTVPTPPCELSSRLRPPVSPAVRADCETKAPRARRKAAPCLLCPALAGAWAGPRPSRPLPPWPCPGALWQVPLRVQGGEG